MIVKRCVVDKLYAIEFLYIFNMHTKVKVNLDYLLIERGMSLTELSEAVDISIANLSILKRGKAKAIRFSTLVKLCETLACQPGDLLEVRE